MTHEERNSVLIWRWGWLASSETFIRNQFDSYSAWVPVALGAERIESSNARAADRALFSNGIVDVFFRRMLKLFDWSPRLLKAAREIDPDVVHAHFGGDASRIRNVARRLRKPLVVTVHGADVTERPARAGLRGFRNRVRLRRVFRDAARIIAVSEFIRDESIRWGADPAKVVVHHIGIPIQISARPTDESEDWDVIFVGRLVAKKGVRDMLYAVDRASVSLGRRLRVAVVGDGALRNDLERQSVGINATVDFLGKQSPDHVQELLQRAKVFVGPSQRAGNGDSEGFGMVFLEAAAAGIPSVAYRHGGVVEAVAHGISGLLAEEGDTDELSALLLSLLADEDMRRRMGVAARERVVAEFDVRTQTALLELIYQDVMNRSERGE